MAGKYQAYPEYKDSGIECLGMLPSHWVVQSLSIASRRISVGLATSVTEYYRDEGVPIIRNMNIKEGYFDGSDMLYLDEKFATANSGKVVYEGDVIAVHTGSNLGLACIVPEEFDNCHTFTTLIVTTSEELLNRYLTYCINSAYGKAEVHRLKFGFGKDNLNVKEFKCFYTLIPEYFEQEKIVNFLDHETAKIDTLIEKQQQLIKLLKEKRQALISHAVTKGLNPNAPMRDSGVEWLGEVPEHWDVCRVKQITNFITSGPRGWSDYLSENGEDIFLQSGDLNYKLGLELAGAKKVSPPSNAEGVRTKLENGDVVVCITGANTGRVAITPELDGTVYINQHLSLIRPIKSLMDSDYLGLVLSSGSVKSYFSVTQYGLKEGLSLSNVGEAPTCRPPLKEQKEIVKYAMNSSDKYDALESCAEKQVALLRERRTALISAAVTGKIDVRNWKAPEPTNIQNKEVAA